MAVRAIGVALLFSSLPLVGCGTVANLARPGPNGGKIPFGGVRHDVSSIEKLAHGDCGCRPYSQSEQNRQVALKLFCAADVPFSFIGDVVTWPYAATYTYINQPVPTPPIKQVPYLPVSQGPIPPVSQTTAQGQPQTSPQVPCKSIRG
jgi:uncharacterized protein YceK